jgi:hypothetical protein
MEGRSARPGQRATAFPVDHEKRKPYNGSAVDVDS